jgi:hypothetical protein
VSTSHPGAYGSTEGPQDGEPLNYRPIPTPQPPQPPVPYGTPAPPAPSHPAPSHPAGLPTSAAGARTGSVDRMGGLLMASGLLATLAFFVAGFMGGWTWSWLFFLVPPVLRAYYSGSRNLTERD